MKGYNCNIEWIEPKQEIEPTIDEIMQYELSRINVLSEIQQYLDLKKLQKIIDINGDYFEKQLDKEFSEQLKTKLEQWLLDNPKELQDLKQSIQDSKDGKLIDINLDELFDGYKENR
jgi:hypothetical protein